MPNNPILQTGDPQLGSGAYVLRIQVSKPLQIAFGRYQRGREIAIRAGDWVYVGSAMGRSSSLAHRLIRHATRTATQPAHGIRPALIRHFDCPPPRTKTLHWHVDYLLDRVEVEIVQVLVMHSSTPLELMAAEALDGHAEIVASGLGASDWPGQTHLRFLAAGDAAWQVMVDTISQKLDT